MTAEEATGTPGLYIIQVTELWKSVLRSLRLTKTGIAGVIPPNSFSFYLKRLSWQRLTVICPQGY